MTAPSPTAPSPIGSESARRTPTASFITFPRPRRPRRDAAEDHRSRDDRGALRRRCAKRDQPRKGSDRIRRGQHRRDPRRHRRKHHSRRRAACSEPSAPSSRRCAPRCWRGIERTAKAVGRDVGCAGARHQDHRGRQGGDERSRGGRDRREGAEGGVRRQVQDLRRRARPARIFPSSSTPACPRCFSISASTSRSASPLRATDGPPLPANHSPLFAPVPKPTIETGVRP